MNNLWFGYITVTSIAMAVVQLAIVAAGVFALVHALRAPAQAFTATGKWQKNYWAIALVVAMLLTLAGLNGMGIVIGAIVVLIYLLDVRPKLDEVRRPRY